MAAYAALVSLMNTMDQIQIHPRFSTSFNKTQIESLGDTVNFLLDFIESDNCGGRSKQVEDLEGEITSAAHAAEDVIESHIVDLIHNEFTYVEEDAIEYVHDLILGDGSNIWGLLKKMMRYIWQKVMRLQLPCVICDLQKEMEAMDLIKENVRNVETKGRLKDQTPLAASSTPVSAGNTTMVGFDDYLICLLDRLTGQQSRLQVIPIIGMGGIGKTTLTKNAFENLLTKQHFDFCAWATISQNYNVREILLQLLSSQEDSKKFMSLSEHQLGEKLHKCLFSRRYLIVLDDMWSIEVWDDIKFFFPDNNNGSRIVVTTRLLDISYDFNSPYLTISFLDEDKSWNLFCQEAFGEEGCPAELEEVGRKICENCKGLPLSIVVAEGFLRKSSKAQGYWQRVARDMYPILNSEGDNRCLNILSLSYNYLPAHLKPCFLYMSVFAEDDEILVSRLIKLWVGEGILRPSDGQSLEEVGEGYLKDLVDRNLVLVNRWGSNGKKIKVCNVHDLLRELCLRIAEKEKFICVMKVVGIPQARNRERRIVIRDCLFNMKVSLALGSAASLVRSLICKDGGGFSFRLMRVLSVVENAQHNGFLEADLKCVNLRCIDHRFFVWAHDNDIYHPSLDIPKKISLLWNLQSVIIKGYHGHITAPSEIWEMVQLRHVQVSKLYVPEPPRNDRADVVLPNLQTLWNALNVRLTEEVCKRIPNIKKLRLVYSKLPRGCDAASYYCPQNLGRFHKLESLSLRFEILNWRHMFLELKFPSSLKKLSLYGGKLYWEDLEMIGSLPNLEVLKLWAYDMVGSEWNPVEVFRSLKFLEIHSCLHLTEWNADHFHFPVLQKLVLGLMQRLVEIPSGIGEVPTLRIISLYDCNVHCALSAVKILEEQESLGNDDLRVEVVYHLANKYKDRFREMMDEEGFTSNNLHLKNS